ncbi:MAG: divalent-cation tolerance protein CutA [Pseudobacteriovorax sp.]|nr:divalent-cation tolerance protein CutA [Pseudobacteriovorax sp.]
MSAIQMLYVTCSDRDEAAMIAKVLVEERLAACVNLLSADLSIFEWEQRLQNDKEVILLAKTLEDYLPKVVERIEALHSYDVPCILSSSWSAQNSKYYDWVKDQVGPKRPR